MPKLADALKRAGASTVEEFLGLGLSAPPPREGQSLPTVLVKEPKIEFIDDGPGKPEGINRFIGLRPIFAFGNSDGDWQMLQWTAARSGGGGDCRGDRGSRDDHSAGGECGGDASGGERSLHSR